MALGLFDLFLIRSGSNYVPESRSSNEDLTFLCLSTKIIINKIIL
jgi:hypothetical protein